MRMLVTTLPSSVFLLGLQPVLYLSPSESDLDDIKKVALSRTFEYSANVLCENPLG
jgi:hypothetical protein